MSKKPVITLKNIQHAAMLSDETNAFTATVYVDGKRFCEASDHGQGGCIDFHPCKGVTRDQIDALNLLVKETYEPTPSCFDDGEPLDTDLELVVGGIVEQHLRDKYAKADYRKNAKKFAMFMTPDDTEKKGVRVYTMKKGFTLDQYAAHIRKNHGENVVILNLLPEPEAIKLFIEASPQ